MDTQTGKNIDKKYKFKRKFLIVTVNKKKSQLTPPHNTFTPTHPQPLMNGIYRLHQVTEYNRVILQQDNNLIRRAATAVRSNIKHGDGRGGDTDSRKYKKKRSRENRNYIYYSYMHRTTSIPSNTPWGNSTRNNGDGRNSIEKDNTGNTKKMQEKCSSY